MSNSFGIGSETDAAVEEAAVLVRLLFRCGDDEDSGDVAFVAAGLMFKSSSTK